MATLTGNQLRVLKMIRDAPMREANPMAPFLQFGIEDYVFYVALGPDSDIKQGLKELLKQRLIDKMQSQELYRLTYSGCAVFDPDALDAVP